MYGLSDFRKLTKENNTPVKLMQENLLTDHQLLIKSFPILEEISSACFDIEYRQGQCKTKLLEKFGGKHKVLAQRRAKGILLKLDSEGMAVLSKIKARDDANSSRLRYYIDNNLEIPEPKSEADWIIFYQQNCLCLLSNYFNETLLIFKGMQEPDSSYSRDVWFRDSSLRHASIMWLHSTKEGNFYDGDKLYTGLRGYMLKCIRRAEAHLRIKAGKFQP